MIDTCLPAGFTFTKTALGTFQACPYRFRLRYLDQVPWPALPAEPAAEALLERGRRFHELARQRFLGLDVSGQVVADEEIARWWAALEGFLPQLEDYPRRYPEAGLSVPLGRYRLAARFDLLAVSDAAALIVDWKTGRPLPAAARLRREIQTRVFLYTLAEGGATYHAGRPFPPQALAILYWHPQGPQQARLAYSAKQRDRDRLFLETLVAEIAGRPREELQRTADQDTCAQCVYAPLCGRPGGAAALEWEPEEEPIPPEMETWPL